MPNLPGRLRSGKSAASSRRAARVASVRARTAALVGRPLVGIGSPIRIRTRLPNEYQVVPLMATGTIGTPLRTAK